MSVISSQSLPPLAAVVAQDAAAIAASDGVLSLYRRAASGAAAGEQVRVMIIDGGRRPAMLPMGSGVARGMPTHEEHKVSIHVPRCSDAAELASGARVSPSGGVYGLAKGDTFEVPGWAVDRPSDPTVRITVGTIGTLGQGTYTVQGSVL